MNATWRIFVGLAVFAVALVSPATANLILYFPMEETESPLVDLASGLTAEATDFGHLYSVPGPEGFGNAIALEENGSWQLDVEESAPLREMANDFTVAAWIYLDSDTLDYKAGSAEPNYRLSRFLGDDIAWDADGWGMGVWDDGRVRFTKNGIIDMDTVDSWVDPDTWVHLAATISSDEGVSIYVNGEFAQLFPDTSDLNNGTGNNGQDDVYAVGRTYGIGEGQWVGGRMDEIRVYDSVLSEEEIAGLLVPDGPGFRGDFNNNGEIDLEDIDILTTQSASGDNLPQYDLTGDGLVDVADVNEWAKAKDIGYTWIGDANYDGQFNTSDFVQVLGIGKYEQPGATAVWSEGDWNGDGVFGTGDLVAALSDGGYELGPRTDVAAVPEPGAIVLSLLGLAGLLRFGRRVRD